VEQLKVSQRPIPNAYDSNYRLLKYNGLCEICLTEWDGIAATGGHSWITKDGFLNALCGLGGDWVNQPLRKIMPMTNFCLPSEAGRSTSMPCRTGFLPQVSIRTTRLL